MRHLLIGLTLLLIPAAAHAVPMSFTATAVLSTHALPLGTGVPLPIQIDYTLDFGHAFSALYSMDFAVAFGGPGFVFGTTFHFTNPGPGCVMQPHCIPNPDWWVTEFADGHDTGVILVEASDSGRDARVCLGYVPAGCGQIFLPNGTNQLVSVDITVRADEQVVPEPGLGWLFVLALVGTVYWPPVRRRGSTGA